MFPFLNIAADASNIVGGENPEYTRYELLAVYPQFIGLLPDEVLDMYLALAHASIKIGRWNEAWRLGMGLFIAHWCTLWLQSSQDPGSPAATVITAGQTRGLTAAKSVDGVSVSYDFSSVLGDLGGWASWKSTAFGVQLATLGKLVGMGSMYVR